MDADNNACPIPQRDTCAHFYSHPIRHFIFTNPAERNANGHEYANGHKHTEGAILCHR